MVARPASAPPLNAANEAYGAAVVVGVFSFILTRPNALDDILRVLAPGAPLVIGLNGPFWGEGTMSDKLHALETSGRVDLLAEEHGDHIRGTGATGWTVAVRKAAGVR